MARFIASTMDRSAAPLLFTNPAIPHIKLLRLCSRLQTLFERPRPCCTHGVLILPTFFEQCPSDGNENEQKHLYLRPL
ncbi:MAG TPA: hypothetical protein VJL58_06325, partial [Pyrinomonadaceae bacterium]|nr:hypothetical protein [Pyrinomonadaceae bacterium]